MRSQPKQAGEISWRKCRLSRGLRKEKSRARAFGQRGCMCTSPEAGADVDRSETSKGAGRARVGDPGSTDTEVPEGL